jgi:hypothetical protein
MGVNGTLVLLSGNQGSSGWPSSRVPIGDLKHRLSAKLLPLVEEYREKLAKLSADQGAKLVLE